MKYYIDTEFLEGTQKENFPVSLFRKNTPPTIDLISVGIVAEDGREYYAISKDFNLKEAWNRYQIKKDFGKPQGLGDKKVYWIRENVLKPIYEEMFSKAIHDKDYNRKYFCCLAFNYADLKCLIDWYGKTNKQISEEIKDFVACDCKKGIQQAYDHYNSEGLCTNNPEFYAYYADYDWVAFCWLFGKMIDLPKGFPMYCIDLKQEFDEACLRFIKNRRNDKRTYTIHPNETLNTLQKQLKTKADYPKQENEHNALDDAKWNKKLHKFLKTL